MDGWIDGWMDEWMNGEIILHKGKFLQILVHTVI